MSQAVLSFKRDSAQLISVLMDGVLFRHGEYWTAVPREVVYNPSGAESLVFEIFRLENFSKPSFMTRWLQAIRPGSLTLTGSPALSVFLNGMVKGWSCSLGVAFLAFLGVLFFQISVNLLNDVEDYLRFIDLPPTCGGSGVLQKGWLNARQLRRVGLFFLVLGMGMGVPAVIQSPKILLVIGGIGVLGVYGYSNPPIGIKYRKLGDFLVFLLGGPCLALGFSQAAFLQWDGSVFGLGFFFGFIAWAISFAHRLQNIEIDPLKGFQTLASRIGFKKSQALFIAFYILAYSSIFFAKLSFFVSCTLLLGIPVIVRFLYRIHKASGPASALLGSIRSDAVRIHLLLGLLLSIGFLIEWLVKIF